jgi:hypothetical protein
VGLGGRETPISVAGPLHRQADGLPSGEGKVVAQAYLVSPEEEGTAGHRKEEAVGHANAGLVVNEHRSQAPPDAPVIYAHLRLGSAGPVDLLALGLAEAFDVELVEVSQVVGEVAVLVLGRLEKVDRLQDRCRLTADEGEKHVVVQKEVLEEVRLGAAVEVVVVFFWLDVCFSEQEGIGHAPPHLRVNLPQDSVTVGKQVLSRLVFDDV